jgi:hypothetical protein
MTLGNFAAFFIFTFFPCMPPRLLPQEYGFHDTVRQQNAESVWMGGNYVNQLAAMPSLHFTYAFCVGSTFLYHSGVFRKASRGTGEPRKPFYSQVLFLIAGVCYPLLVLTIIVATANHYWLDAVVAMGTTTLSFFCNKVCVGCSESTSPCRPLAIGSSEGRRSISPLKTRRCLEGALCELDLGHS